MSDIYIYIWVNETYNLMIFFLVLATVQSHLSMLTLPGTWWRFFLSHFVPGTIPDLPCNPRHSNSRERPHPPSPWDLRRSFWRWTGDMRKRRRHCTKGFFSSRRKNHMANMTKLCQNHLPNHDQVDCWPYLVKTPRLGELAPFPSPVKKSKFQCICTVFNARITHTTKRNQYNPSYKTHGPYQIGSNEGCVG